MERLSGRDDSAGIYLIVIDGARYVGKALNLGRRRHGHLAALNTGRGAPLLQAAYDEHEDDCSFYVLERCPAWDRVYVGDDALVDDLTAGWLHERERHWCRELRPELNQQVPAP